MASQPVSTCIISILFFCVQASPIRGHALARNEKGEKASSKTAASRPDAPAKQPSSEEQLQQSINNYGNDRASLVGKLEASLNETPDLHQRAQVYRALVCACGQP